MAPDLSLAGVRLVIADRAMGLPVLRTLSLCTCRRHYPGAALNVSSLISSSVFPQKVPSFPPPPTLIEGFSHFVTSMTAPMLPAGAVAGWGLHPLESAAFARRTPGADIGCEAGCPLILPEAEGEIPVLLRIVQRKRPLNMLSTGPQISKMCARKSENPVSRRRASFRSGHGACWSRCAPVIAPRSSRPTTSTVCIRKSCCCPSDRKPQRFLPAPNNS